MYMTLPLRFDKGRGQKVCKLNKSIYDLKQSPRAWFNRFSPVIKSEGFKQGYRITLFVHKIENSITLLIVYVDDIISQAIMMGR